MIFLFREVMFKISHIYILFYHIQYFLIFYMGTFGEAEASLPGCWVERCGGAQPTVL